MSPWRDIWARNSVCDARGHLWGDRLWWGDSARERNATHRCARCGRMGTPPATVEGET